MNELEIYKSMLKQYEKNKDVVGDEENPNVYNSINIPKKTCFIKFYRRRNLWFKKKN